MYLSNKYWANLTKDLSQEEVDDLQTAKNTLENYNKIYEIAEYTSELHDSITTLEKRIQTNNPTMPQNIYRKCGANSITNLMPEVEAYLQAYYDLMDDCAAYPLWQRKLEEDLGQSVSFLGIMMEEADRDLIVENS